MEGNAEQNDQTLIIPNVIPDPVPAFDLGAFDSQECLTCIHQEVSDFLHYQSHVWLFAAMTLPATVPRPDDTTKECIIKLLKEENRRLKVLHKLLLSLEANNSELISTYEETTTNWNAEGWQQNP
jgi:hypothetical protein